MSKWIVQAENLPAIAECDNLLAKKVVSKEIFGSNLRLSASVASGTAQHPWDFVLSAKTAVKNAENFQQCDLLERVRGLEPLQNAWKAFVLPLHHTRLR